MISAQVEIVPGDTGEIFRSFRRGQRTPGRLLLATLRQPQLRLVLDQLPGRKTLYLGRLGALPDESESDCFDGLELSVAERFTDQKRYHAIARVEDECDVVRPVCHELKI